MATIEVPAAWTIEEALRGGVASETPADARTVEELAAACGHDVKWVRKRLAQLKAEGKVEVIKVRRYRLDDQSYTAPAYRLLNSDL
jgi:hypothetical protein